MAGNADILAAITSLQATYTTGHQALEEKVDNIAAMLREQNGRVRKLETEEAILREQVKTLPTRVATLENVAAEMRGVSRAVKWALGGSGLAGLISLLAFLLGMVK